MRKLSDMGVAARLALIFAAAAVTIAGVALIGLASRSEIIAQADRLHVLERARGLLHHLDTREAELKVNAYRSALEPDLTDLAADLPEDLATVDETLAALDALPLPATLRAQVDGVRPEVADFSAFVADFVGTAQRDQAAARRLEPQVAARNDVVDSELEKVHESAAAAIDDARRQLDDAVARARLWTWLTILAGALALGGLCLPTGRSLLRGIRRVGDVLEAVADGDLTRRAELDSRDELGRMAGALDRATASMRESLTTVAHGADALVGALARLSAVNGEVTDAAATTQALTVQSSADADGIAHHVQAVAAGADELGVSIREISRSTTEAVQVAGVAVAEAARPSRRSSSSVRRRWRSATW